jgi:hypothetical protein
MRLEEQSSRRRSTKRDMVKNLMCQASGGCTNEAETIIIDNSESITLHLCNRHFRFYEKTKKKPQKLNRVSA